MLKVTNLKKKYFETLFEEVTFLLGNDEKVGLVGLNGCGKSTLLKILIGEEKPDDGQVEVVNETIGYLPQEYELDNELLIGEFLEDLVDDAYSQMYKIDIILAKLNEKNLDHFKYISSLSEGQKMKLKLTEVLIDEPSVLLLDEPTNHLDIEGITWLEGFINSFEGICIMISHDRQFLNSVCTNIFEIDNQKLLQFEGNYDDYLEQKSQYIKKREKEFKAFERKKQQLEELVDRARSVKSGGKRGKAVRAAKTRYKREVEDRKVEEYEEQRIREFDLEGNVHDKKKIVEVRGLSFSYKDEDEKIFNNTRFDIWGRQKVWLFGPNGVGKTTFIKLLMGKLEPNKGEIDWGANINWTYFSQDQKHLDMQASVEDFFMDQTGIVYEKSFGTLKRFLFPKELRKYKLKTLSPGQRARLSFACFAQGEYDFLILDEPTNHLDIKTKQVIESALREFNGAILLISHDRYFVKSVDIDRKFTIENKRLIEDRSLKLV